MTLAERGGVAPRPPGRSRPAVAASGLCGGCRNSDLVLRNVSFEMEVGQSLAVVGPSGAGKSTLLNIVVGFLPPASGMLCVAGHDLSGSTGHVRERVRLAHIGFAPQDPTLVPVLTVLENVAVPLEVRGEPHALDHAREVLSKVGLGGVLSRYPDELSGGERQRVAVARALARRPLVLVADEPTSNLDEAARELVCELMFDAVRRGEMALLTATHDPVLMRRCDGVLDLGRDQKSVFRNIEGEGRNGYDIRQL